MCKGLRKLRDNDDVAKAGCELIYVGKENHKHVMKQDAINEILYEKSKYHELVVRLVTFMA